MKIKSIIISLLVLMYSSYAFEKSDRDISIAGPSTENIDESRYFVIYYVCQQNGSDTQGVGSRTNPWNSLHFAMTNATQASSENIVGIFVAEGRYSDTTIILKPYMDLYGGFAPNTWQRDIFKYSTILDGDNIRRVVVGADDARIDGFTITNGRVRSHGGGVLCDDTSPIVSNCFIMNNFVIEPDDFNHNRIHQEGHHGGGIASLYNAAPVIRNNVFFENKTSVGNGAAIAFFGWLRRDDAPSRRIEDNFMSGGIQPIVKGNVFIQNIAGVNDIHNTRSSNGGAISSAYESRPIISNNIMIGNQVKGNSDGGAIYNEFYSYPVIIGNWIVGNIADDDGGAIYTMRMGHPIIENNFIAGNMTKQTNNYGGIRLSKEGRARIVNNTIVRNETGGGVQSYDSYLELKDNVIMDNKGRGGVHFTTEFDYFKPSAIEGNTIRNNEGVSIRIDQNELAMVSIKNNNLSDNSVKDSNYNRPVEFADESITGEVKNYSYNSRTYQTLIDIPNQPDKGTLEGRVIKVGAFWGVIRKVEGVTLYVWGNFTDQTLASPEYEIISTYAFDR
jgi:hypothetical protein